MNDHTQGRVLLLTLHNARCTGVPVNTNVPEASEKTPNTCHLLVLNCEDLSHLAENGAHLQRMGGNIFVAYLFGPCARLWLVSWRILTGRRSQRQGAPAVNKISLPRLELITLYPISTDS